MEVLLSQRGAETMPGGWKRCKLGNTAYRVNFGRHTILDENVQALLDQQGGIKDYEAETEGQDIITSPHFQKGAYDFLQAP